jgi:hypothetical protein
MTMPSQ